MPPAARAQWFAAPRELADKLERRYFWAQRRVHPTDASSLPPPAAGFFIAPTSSPDQVEAVSSLAAP